MAKKPILTDDDLDGGLSAPLALPSRAVSGAILGGAVTRPLDGAAPVLPPQPLTGAQDRADGDIPAPTAPGRAAHGHSRPRTRILGYGEETPRQASDAPRPGGSAAVGAAPIPVVGWLVSVAGPVRGAAVSLGAGMNGIWRGPKTTAQIDFGDDRIIRDPHAYLTYDDEACSFHLSHGSKTNLVRRDDHPVLAPEVLSQGDTIRIWATAMRFLALCGPDFDRSDR